MLVKGATGVKKCSVSNKHFFCPWTSQNSQLDSPGITAHACILWTWFNYFYPKLTLLRKCILSLWVIRVICTTIKYQSTYSWSREWSYPVWKSTTGLPVDDHYLYRDAERPSPHASLQTVLRAHPTSTPAQRYTHPTLRPRQDGHHFPDDNLKCIFLNEYI